MNGVALAPVSSVRHAGGADPHVVVLLCGSADRGDDGAAIAAMPFIRPRLDDDVDVRVVGQLDVLDLVDLPTGAGVVVVDAALGLRRGTIVVLPLDGLVGQSEIRPRSSHAIAVREVIAVADMLRGHPLAGRVVAVGGRQFGVGAPMSASVARALPALGDAVIGAVAAVRS